MLLYHPSSSIAAVISPCVGVVVALGAQQMGINKNVFTRHIISLVIELLGAFIWLFLCLLKSPRQSRSSGHSCSRIALTALLALIHSYAVRKQRHSSYFKRSDVAAVS